MWSKLRNSKNRSLMTSLFGIKFARLDESPKCHAFVPFAGQSGFFIDILHPLEFPLLEVVDNFA